MEVLVPIAFFALAFGIVYVVVSSRHKERIALVEKGLSADIFVQNKSKIPSGVYFILNAGLIFVGIALGSLLGSSLENSGMNPEVVMPACIFLMSGIAMIGGFLLTMKLIKKNKE